MAWSIRYDPVVGQVVRVPLAGALTAAGNAPTKGLPVTDTPLAGAATVSGNAPTVSVSTSFNADTDFNKRASGPAVVWAHAFRNASEVNQFRDTSGYGMDPVQAGSSGASSVQWQAAGFGSGGFVRETIPTGGLANSNWIRPFGAFRAGQPVGGGQGNGLTTDDPAANGTVRKNTWDSSATSEAYNFRQAYYASPGTQAQYPYWPLPANTGVYDGQDFWFQFSVRISPTRWSPGNPAGKLLFIDVTEQISDMQELVIRSVNNPDSGFSGKTFADTNPFLVYTSRGGTANSNVQSVQADGGTYIGSAEPGGPYASTCLFSGNLSVPGVCWEFPRAKFTTLLVHVMPGNDNQNEFQGIQSVSSTNPAVVTLKTGGGQPAPPPYASGNHMAISYNPGGAWNALNGAWVITVIDSTHFSIPLNASGFPAYTDGGQTATATRLVQDWQYQDTTLEVWKCDREAGETEYTKVFEHFRLALFYQTGPQSAQNGPNGQYHAPAFNEIAATGYMNDVGAAVGWTQDYTEFVFSHDYIAPPGQTAAAWFLSQADNSWTTVAAPSNQQIGAVQQTPYGIQGTGPGGSTAFSQSGIASFTGMYVDQRRAEYGCAANGGHGDGDDNSAFGLYLRDPNPTWRRLSDRTPDSQMTTSDLEVPLDSRKFLDGRPRAMHSTPQQWGDGRVWFPAMSSTTSGEGGSADAVLSFDRDTLGAARTPLAYTTANIGPWTFWGPTNQNPNWFGFGGSCFDRIGHQLIAVSNGSGSFGIAWQLVPTIGPNAGVSTAFLDGGHFIMPYWVVCAHDLRIVVVFNGVDNTVYWLDLNPANTATYNKWSGPVATSGTAYNPTPGGINPSSGRLYYSESIAGCNGSGNYIPKNRCIAVIDPIAINGQVFKLAIPTKLDSHSCVIFDPAGTWVWSSLPGTAGTPPTGASAFGGGNTLPSRGKLVEDMGNGQSALVFLGNYNTPTYVYKIPAAGL